VNLFISDIQASLISVKEYHIKTYNELIDRTDISIFVDKDSYAFKILKKVN